MTCGSVSWELGGSRGVTVGFNQGNSLRDAKCLASYLITISSPSLLHLETTPKEREIRRGRSFGAQCAIPAQVNRFGPHGFKHSREPSTDHPVFRITNRTPILCHISLPLPKYCSCLLFTARLCNVFDKRYTPGPRRCRRPSGIRGRTSVDLEASPSPPDSCPNRRVAPYTNRVHLVCDTLLRLDVRFLAL